MNVTELKNKLHGKCDELMHLIMANMHEQGQTSETCQRMCLLNHLGNFRHAVNGIEESDLRSFQDKAGPVPPGGVKRLYMVNAQVLAEGDDVPVWSGVLKVWAFGPEDIHKEATAKAEDTLIEFDQRINPHLRIVSYEEHK